MPTTHVVYDITTGRILAAHHFRGESADPEMTRNAIIGFSELDLSDAEIGVVPVTEYPADERRRYKIDVNTLKLVEVAADEGGIGFAFGGILTEQLPPAVA